MRKTDPSSDLGRIKALEPGQTTAFPLAKMMNVRAMAANYGKMLGRKYTTRSDAARVYITRME